MRFHSIPVGALSLATVLALPAGTLRAQSRDPDIEALREQIRQLDQQLRVLERKQELKDEEAAARTRAAPVVAAGAGGFSLTSGDKRFQLRLSGLLQADARFYGTNSPSNHTFLLRRVRPTFQGTFNEKFGIRLTPEFAGSSFSLLDANVTYAASPAFQLLIGKAKSPFDLERLVSGGALRFVERAYPTTLGPNRDIGIQLSGDVLEQRLNYTLGWGNGVPDNGSSVSNPDSDFEFALRLVAQPFVNDPDSLLHGLGIGVALTHGDKHSGAPAGYSTLAQQTFFAWNAGVTQSGEHFRWSPQGYYFVGRFGLLASYTDSRQELTRAGVERTVENSGYLLQASYVLTGEAASLRGVTPSRPFHWGGEGWGALEIAARISGLKIGRHAFSGSPADRLANPSSSARQVTSTTLGANWYLNRNLKAVFNYEFSEFEGGGDGTAGPGAVTAHQEHAIFARAQLGF
jgi:phosphate-selective porin OprO and OprP